MSSAPLAASRILVIDVETTGFDPARHACIELGAVLLDASLQPVREYTSLIAPRPGAEIVDRAMEVNGISREELRHAPPPAVVIGELLAQIAPLDPPPLLAGWNVWFDAQFLQQLFVQAGQTWPFGHRYLDVQSIVSFHLRLAAISQAEAIERFWGETQTHRALPDARHTARILRLQTAFHWPR